MICFNRVLVPYLIVLFVFISFLSQPTEANLPLQSLETQIPSHPTVREESDIARPLSHLEIIKFLDVNGNGIHDTSEPTLAGVRFFINGMDRSIEAVTGQNGTIDMDLTSGVYQISEELIPGWFQTTPPVQAVSLIPGESRKVFFGNFRHGIIENSELMLKLKSGEPVVYNNVIINGAIDANKLNLTNILSDINITNSEINGNVNLSNHNFFGQVDFSGTTFEGFADFSHSTFREKANFENATFLSYVSFTGSSHNINFRNINYNNSYPLNNSVEASPKDVPKGNWMDMQIDLQIWIGLISIFTAAITFIIGLIYLRRRGKQNG